MDGSGRGSECELLDCGLNCMCESYFYRAHDLGSIWLTEEIYRPMVLVMFP